MNKDQRDLLIKAYNVYSDAHWTPPEDPNSELICPQLWSLVPKEHSIESFINECKTNPNFSKKWGLKIEERELSLEERYKIMQSNISTATLGKPSMYNHTYYDSKHIPSKLISITYDNQIIESHE